MQLEKGQRVGANLRDPDKEIFRQIKLALANGHHVFIRGTALNGRFVGVPLYQLDDLDPILKEAVSAGELVIVRGIPE